MKIPKKIKIGGHIYQIIMRDREFEDGGTVGAVGTCDNKFNKIWIDKRWVQSQQETTLIHEIIEAINWNWKLELTHPQIQGLEASFYQVLKDNKIIN